MRSPVRLMLITNIPTPYRQDFYSALHQFLDERGVDLFVLFLTGREPNRHWVIDPESYRYYHRILTSEPFRYGHIDTYPSLKPFLHWRRYKPSVTILAGAWHYPSNILIGLWARLIGARVIFWCEANRYSDKSKGAMANAIRRWAYRLFGEFAVPGIESGNYLRRFFDHPRMVRLPNSVADHFYEQPVALGQDRAAAQRNNYLFVGELSHRKGAVPMILSFLEALDAGTLPADARLNICGDGPLLQEVARLAEGCPAIRLHGFVSSAGLKSFWDSNGVLLLHTELDPNPLVVNEACAAGLIPVLSSRAGNAADLLAAGLDSELVFEPGEMGSALRYYAGLSDEALLRLRLRMMRYGQEFQAATVARNLALQIFEEA